MDILAVCLDGSTSGEGKYHGKIDEIVYYYLRPQNRKDIPALDKFQVVYWICP